MTGKNRMTFISKFLPIIVIGAIFLCFSSGCTTGALISGMGSASSGASHAVGPGSKIVSYQIVYFENAVQGTIRATEALALENKKTVIRENQAEFRYADERDQYIDIKIERRSAKITAIEVDAGFFGPRGLTRLVLLRIIEELDQAGAQPEDWTD